MNEVDELGNNALHLALMAGSDLGEVVGRSAVTRGQQRDYSFDMDALELLNIVGLGPELLVLAMANFASRHRDCDEIDTATLIGVVPLQRADLAFLTRNLISESSLRATWKGLQSEMVPLEHFSTGIRAFCRETYPSRKWTSQPFVTVADVFQKLVITKEEVIRLTWLEEHVLDQAGAREKSQYSWQHLRRRYHPEYFARTILDPRDLPLVSGRTVSWQKFLEVGFCRTRELVRG